MNPAPPLLLAPPPFVRVWRPHAALELVLAQQGRYDGPAHVHEELELAIAPLHERTLQVGRTRLTVPPGAVTVVPPGTAHHTGAVQYAGPFYSVRVGPELAAGLGDALELRPVVHPGQGAGHALAAALLRLHRQSGHAPGLDPLTLESQVLDLLSLLSGDETPTAPRPAPRSIRDARARLDDAPGEAVTLGELAAAAQMSPFHFARLFRAATGLTPHAYLLDARIRRAKHLLLQGEPLPQVALSLGFASQSHFAQVFRQRVGVTPGVYRQDSRNLVDRERLWRAQ